MAPLAHEQEGNDDLPDLVTRSILEFEQGGDEAVDRLLAAHPALANEARAQLLALRDAGLLAPPVPEPEQLGPYRVLRRLGSGAVGSVYLAEQAAPMRRQVAIKVIRPGMDSREVLARFAIERQMLALLDHPNVARALAAGVTNDGRPYLCMEYVAGQPITRYCEARRLDLRQRVELMAQICDAVHAAHQKGILHRDLKPSNILVSDRDEKPWPTVIDFGVAKSLGPRLLDVTLLTGRGRLVGTPEYMSPEQAASEIDVDTRTDVHALGVILYELLSGHLPIASERLRRADMVQLLRMLQQESTPLPSAAVRSHAAEQPQAAAKLAEQRRTNPTSLVRELTGELDWIVQRATETDRNRRYGMAADMAADLRRYLRYEPVLAGPHSAWYRGTKFLRRNRLQVGAVAAVLVALLGGFCASLVFYQQAAREAEQSAESLDIAVAAVEHMVQAGDEDLNVVPHMEDVRRQLLAEALKLQRRLASNSNGTRLHLRTVRVLAAVAKVHAQLAQFDQAVARADEATALLDELQSTPNTKTALDSKLAADETHHLQASLAFAKASWIEVLGHAKHEVDQLLLQASDHVDRISKQPTQAQRLLAASIWGRRGSDLGGSDAGTARAMFQRALLLLQPVFAAAQREDVLPPSALAVLAYYARFCIQIGDHETAITTAGQLQQLVDSVLTRVPDAIGRAPYSAAIEQLAAVWYRTEKFEKVAAALAPALELRRDLIRDFPSMPAHRSGLAIVLVNRALAASQLGLLDEAQADLVEARNLLQELLVTHASVMHYHELATRVAIHLVQHCMVRTRYGLPLDATLAQASITAGQTSLDALATTESNAWLELRAEMAASRGLVAEHQGQAELAATAQTEAIASYERLLAKEPSTVLIATQLIDAKKLLVRNLLRLNRIDAAEPILADAMQAHAALRDKLGTSEILATLGREFLQLRIQIDTNRHRFADVLQHIDSYLQQTDEPDEDWIGRDTMAKAALAAARAANAAAIEATPNQNEPSWCEPLVAKAREVLQKSIAPTRPASDPPNLMVAVMRSNSLQTLVTVEREFGSPHDALAMQVEVLAGYQASFAARPTTRSRQRLVAALQLVLELCDAAGDSDGAKQYRQQLDALPPASK